MKKWFGLTVLVLAMQVSNLAMAAEEPAALPVDEDETEYSYGTVKSSAADQIVVSEYDFEADKDVDVTYSVDPQAEFENVAKAADIAVGDNIEVDYVVKEGKKIAKFISVEKPLEETDAAEAPAEPAAAPAAEPAL